MKGKGLWKFNNSLLHDTEYVKLVKKQIKDVKEQYSVHVYNKEALRDIDNLDIQLTMNDQLFLEILLTEIRGKTISYATFKKRESVKLENTLTREIRKLEENAQSDQNLIEIEEKKSQLRILRQNEMRVQYNRSRKQWIEEGEKPTNYFCNLENNFFSQKLSRSW